jgi:hypothetical protein
MVGQDHSLTQTLHELVTERFGILPNFFRTAARGYPAGDAQAQPETVTQILKLLRRPVPDAEGDASL